MSLSKDDVAIYRKIMFQKLIDIVRGYLKKYPEGNTSFQIATRLAEETGEVASDVTHMEGGKAKLAKLGKPDRNHLALELQHVMQATLTLVEHYGLWKELENSINATHKTLTKEGFIPPKHQ